MPRPVILDPHNFLTCIVISIVDLFHPYRYLPFMILLTWHPVDTIPAQVAVRKITLDGKHRLLSSKNVIISCTVAPDAMVTVISSSGPPDRLEIANWTKS